jgi:hypothetical protein
MYIGLHVKYPLFLPDFNETWIFSTDIPEILKYQISWKSVQWEPSCSMRTDRHDKDNGRFPQFFERDLRITNNKFSQFDILTTRPPDYKPGVIKKLGPKDNRWASKPCTTDKNDYNCNIRRPLVYLWLKEDCIQQNDFPPSSTGWKVNVSLQSDEVRAAWR